MQIGSESVVTIHYTLTDEKGVVLDSSAGEEPISFVHGAGTMIPGLEKALLGKSAGDALKISVAPADGYGVRDEELVQKVPRKNSRLPTWRWACTFRRAARADAHRHGAGNRHENITVDANHRWRVPR